MTRHVIGVISDTHGLVRPEACAALAGSETILHAGDIGKPEVIDRLAEIAPVVAIRGNVDRGDWAASLPDTEWVAFGAAHVYMLHDVKTLDLDPVAAGVAVVVAGHSHQPRAERRDGVLYLNPGSAGPRRFRLPVAVARLVVADDTVDASIVTLDV